MSVVLIGGMDRLGGHYLQEARNQGVELRIFSQATIKMATKIKHADAVVIFTNKVSHKARNEALTAAKRQGIPVLMHHACGVCTLRECLHCLTTAHDSHQNLTRN
jgi:hypothetical protein